MTRVTSKSIANLGRFSHSVPVLCNTTPNNIQAKAENSVLTVTLLHKSARTGGQAHYYWISFPSVFSLRLCSLFYYKNPLHAISFRCTYVSAQLTDGPRFTIQTESTIIVFMRTRKPFSTVMLFLENIRPTCARVCIQFV